MKEIFVGSVAKNIERDNWEKGCYGTFTDFGIIANHFRAGSIRELLKEISDFFGFSAADVYFDECNNCFLFDREENDGGNEATPAEMGRFKAGKIDLWVARYECYIRRESEVSADEMQAAINA